MGIMGSAPKSFPFDNPGDTCTGVIITEPEEVDQTDQDTAEVKRWANGQAKKVWKIRLLTELRNPDDPFDEGERTLWVKWKSLDAIRNAVRAAGAKDLEVGGILALRLTGFGVAEKRGYNPPKEWAAKYTPPPPQSKSDGFMDSGSTKQAAPDNLESQRVAQKAQQATVLERLKAAGMSAEPVSGANPGFAEEPPF